MSRSAAGELDSSDDLLPKRKTDIVADKPVAESRKLDMLFMPKRIRRQKVSPRYYIYVSDTKLDMLFEQINLRTRKSISVELRIDLKLASVTLSNSDAPAPARMAKLQIVEEYIIRNCEMGTIKDSSTAYFCGTMDMQWAWLESWHSNDASPIVLFRGEEESQLVMLAGSRRHVIGEPPDMTARAGSALPHIVTAIRSHFPDDPAIAELPFQPPKWTQPLRAREALFKDTPAQRMDFLAVPLAENYIEDGHLVLGTPIYVALAPGGSSRPHGPQGL
jgi:hypothetical protein